MPTYSVSTSPGQLDDAARRALARDITAAHTATTGAPGFFAQVRFEELEAGQHFIGGVPMTDDFVFVHGQIRSGRTTEQKRALLDALVAAVTDSIDIPRRGVWTRGMGVPRRPAAVEHGGVRAGPTRERQ